MKRIILFILLLLVFSLEVNAHPGRTDGAGGHVDHSTGIYHYHHGYPEHQHNNGICPYNNVNAEHDKSNSAIVASPSIMENNLISNIQTKQTFDKSTLWTIITLVSIFILPYAIKVSFKKIKEMLEWRRKRKYYYEMYANVDPIHLVNIPKGVYIKDGIPITDGLGKYGRYTVYLSAKGRRFHQRPDCCKNAVEKHIFQVYKSYTPCSKCVYVPFPEYKWFIEYRKIVNIKKQYNIP